MFLFSENGTQPDTVNARAAWKNDFDISPVIPQDRIEKLQVERQHKLSQHCRNCTDHDRKSLAPFCKEVLSAADLSWLMVDDVHKLIYCAIPKVAYTNWKFTLLRLLLNLTNETDPVDLRKAGLVHTERFTATVGLRRLSTYKVTERTYRLENYFKFMFTRDPLERLLSAYRSKFRGHSKSTAYFQRRYGRRIIQMYRHNASQTQPNDGRDVTFPEFLMYVSTRAMAGKRLDPHWTSYVDLCHPCTIHYDFLGRFETLETDANHILRNKIQRTGWVPSFPTRTSRSPSSKSVKEDFYQDVQKKSVHMIRSAFAQDFILFGYDVNL